MTQSMNARAVARRFAAWSKDHAPECEWLHTHHQLEHVAAKIRTLQKFGDLLAKDLETVRVWMRKEARASQP